MRRVVVTGIGIVSSIGNDRWEVLESLRQGRSGLEYAEDYKAMGLRSHVRGPLRVDLAALIDRKVLRFMGDAAAYNYLAMREAIADAQLPDDLVSNPRAGLVTGSGGGSPQNIIDAADLLRNKGLKRVGPYMVPRTMSSTTTACLATPFKIKGVNYSISSACATSAHCIGHGAELIQWNKQDIMFVGGGEELHWSLTHLFDAMGALSTKYNAAPQTASRPYDVNRDGFVISGGGGLVVLEELEHARFKRNGDDLLYKAKVDLLTALAGGKFHIEHLDKRILVVHILPGEVIRPGDHKMLVGQGMPSHRHHDMGNMYVEFEIDFPESRWTSEENITLLETILPPRPELPPPPPNVELEESYLADLDASQRNRMENGASNGDDDDDDDQQGPRMQCHHQ